jgi:HK97 family phage portal protein
MDLQTLLKNSPSPLTTSGAVARELLEVEKSLSEEGAKNTKSLSTLVRMLSSGSLFGGMPESLESFLWAHNSQVWVYRCIRVIVCAAVRMQVRLYRDYTKNGLKRTEEITGEHIALDYEEAKDELWSLRPDRMTINVDKRGYLHSFTHTIGGNATEIAAKDMIYGKYYNPSNDYYGLSPMQAATNSINSYLRAQKWNLKYFENSAIPATILTTDYNFNDKDEIEALKTEWNKLYKGFEKAGTTAVLGGGLKVETLTQTHKDMLWDKLQDIARQEISAAFGVTPIYMMTTAGMNYANAREHGRVFWHSKMIPEKIMVEQYVSKFINKRFAEKGETLRVEYDLSQVEALQEDIVKQAEADVKRVNGGLRTHDELRAKDGLEAYPDGIGSRPIIQGGMKPLELADAGFNQAPSPPPEKRAKSLLPDRDSRLKHWMKTKGIVEDLDAKMKRLLIAIFEDWQAEMLSALGDKAAKGISVESILFDRDKAEEMLAKAGGPIITEATEEGGKRALATVSVDAAFDVHDPRVEELIKQSVQRFREEISGVRWERMKDSLNAGISEGETTRELADRVRSTMGHEVNNASTIARSEVLPRYHEGQLEGFEQSGVVEKMEWLSAFTETSREEHMNADGQQVPLGTAFSVGGEMLAYPGDPSGSAENTINCMCDVIAVIEE